MGYLTYRKGYKGQGGWDTVLARFPRGGGTLYDLEFLEDGISNPSTNQHKENVLTPYLRERKESRCIRLRTLAHNPHYNNGPN